MSKTDNTNIEKTVADAVDDAAKPEAKDAMPNPADAESVVSDPIHADEPKAETPVMDSAAELSADEMQEGEKPTEQDVEIPAFANNPTDPIAENESDHGDEDEADADDADAENKPAPKKHRAWMAAGIAAVVVVSLLCMKACSQPYHVTYDNGDGTSYVASYRMGEQINVDTIKKPVRKGYTFDGWYADKELTKPVHTLDQSKSITLYAKWIPQKFSIIYSGIPGGATVTDQDTYSSGERKVLPTYEKEHYEFVGWKLPGGDSVITELSGNETGNLQLEAVFEPETYIISYVSDGITPDAPTTYQYGDSFDLPVSILDGATFGGWYTDTSYQSQMTAITPETFGDLTLYAKFDRTAAASPTASADYSGIVDGKIAAVKSDLGVTVTADGKDEAAANALDIVYSSLSQYTGDARKKLGTIHISDRDGLNGSNIYVNRSSTTISKDLNAEIFRILCGNKSASFEKGWDDYTSYISNKAAIGSVLDDAAETWGYHMAGVYGDDQVSAKFGILYNLYGTYLK